MKKKKLPRLQAVWHIKHHMQYRILNDIPIVTFCTFKLVKAKITSMAKKRTFYIIKNTRKKKYTEEDYLYEVQVLDPIIKRLKSIIRNLKFRRNRNELKFKRKMPSVCLTVL